MAPFIAVALGGMIGSLLRYSIAFIFNRYLLISSSFPWPTYLVNVAGCLFIGYAASVFTRHPETSIATQLFWITGIAGGFTTFSAFALENVQLLQQGHIPIALLYSAVSMIAGLFAVMIGITLGKL